MYPESTNQGCYFALALVLSTVSRRLQLCFKTRCCRRLQLCLKLGAADFSPTSVPILSVLPHTLCLLLCFCCCVFAGEWSGWVVNSSLDWSVIWVDWHVSLCYTHPLAGSPAPTNRPTDECWLSLQLTGGGGGGGAALQGKRGTTRPPARSRLS